MYEIGAEAARKHLPELLDRAYAGEAAVINKRGKPYAVLVPPDQALAQSTGVGFLSLKGSGQGLWGDEVSATIDRYRDEWS
jgi:prevent-host-death family protein